MPEHPNLELFERMFTLFSDGDQRIVAPLRASASSESRTFDGDYLIVFNVVDGQVEEAWEFWMDQAIVDAFWS